MPGEPAEVSPDLPVVAPDVPGDGIVDVPIDLPIGKGDKVMPASEQFNAILEQGGLNNHQGSMHAFRRLMDGSDFIGEQTRLQFLGQQSLFAAKAAQTLNTDGLASDILAQRSARDQPGLKPGT